jgi:hypothetical protein
MLFRYLRKSQPLTYYCAFGLFLLITNWGQIAWGVTSDLTIFVSHLPFAFRRVILWIVLVAQLSTVLHTGSLVSCHNIRSFRLSCRWSKYEGALFRSESESLCVDSLYAKAVDAAKALAAFSASSTVSIWIRGGNKSEARLRTAPSQCGFQLVPKCPQR